jgi:quercetin dioxygenase-like cupin family protein
VADFGVAHIDEIEQRNDGRGEFVPVRWHFGITTFGVTARTAAPGEVVVVEHDEAGDDSGDELYVVTSGRATFVLDGGEHDAPSGTFVHVKPGVRRSAIAREPSTTVLAFGAGAPGRPYEPYDWEQWAPLHALFREGRYEEMIERATPLLAPAPELAPLYYDVACAEVLAGRHDDALTHLATAVAQRPALIGSVRTDPDFDAIRRRPQFAALIEDAAA